MLCNLKGNKIVIAYVGYNTTDNNLLNPSLNITRGIVKGGRVGTYKIIYNTVLTMPLIITALAIV